MRIGILGGTFDPIHEGHLAVAAHALRQFRLDKVFFVPAAVSPFKTGRLSGASDADRLEMARRAITGNPQFEISGWELERGGISYTVDTLRHFHHQFPGAELFLLMGEDTYAGLSLWKESAEVCRLAHIVVAPRTADSAAGGGAEVRRLDMPLCDASSTEIRRVLQHESGTVSGIPQDVCDYIRERKLYRSPRGAAK